MKKLITSVLTLIILTTITPAESQNYYPFPDSNAIWSEYEIYYQGFEPEINPYFMIIAGDTVINNSIYKQVYHSFDTVYNWQEDTYWSSYRQDSTKRVFVVPKDSINEVLLYDFSKSVGDSIWIYEYDQWFSGWLEIPYIIDVIDTILVGDDFRKVYHFNPQTSFYTVFPWVEGVGSMAGLLYHFYPNTIGGWWEFNCLTYNNQMIYQNPETWKTDCYTLTKITNSVAEDFDISIYPNPANDIVIFQSINAKTKYNLEIRNIIGQLVKEAKNIQFSHHAINVADLKAGVYFYVIRYGDKVLQQGKVVVK